MKCNNEPSPETQTLMAHHLIAVLFFHQCSTRPPSAWKPHIRFSSTTEVNYSTSLMLPSLPVQVFLSSPSPTSLPQLFMHCLSFQPCVCIALLLFWIPPLLILFQWLVLSLVQMSPWSAVAWLGDNRSDFETGGKAALLSLTQSYSDEPSTAKVRQREEK